MLSYLRPKSSSLRIPQIQAHNVFVTIILHEKFGIIMTWIGTNFLHRQLSKLYYGHFSKPFEKWHAVFCIFLKNHYSANLSVTYIFLKLSLLQCHSKRSCKKWPVEREHLSNSTWRGDKISLFKLPGQGL